MNAAASCPGIGEVRVLEGALVVALRGGINFDTAPDCRRAVEALVAQHAPRRLVFNLAEVPYLDSAGVALIIAMRRQLLGSGGTVAVAAPQPMVAELLRVVKVDRIVQVASTEGAALGEAWGG